MNRATGMLLKKADFPKNLNSGMTTQIQITSKNDRSYAIIGTGALGGYYGACLQRAGMDVHFLLHRDYDHVHQQGLVVKSINGDFTLPKVQAYHNTQQMPAVDGVVVALKTTQNHLLAKLLPPLLKPDTTVILLQNGLDIEAGVAQLVGDRPVISGLCFICSNKIGPGTIHHLDYGAVMFGQYSPDNLPVGMTESLSAIAADFKAAQIPVDLTADLYLARWRKLVWNIPFNGLSVVLNASTHEMIANAHARELAQQLMEEVVLSANACGDALSPGANRHLPATLVREMLDHTAKMKPYRTSMKIDFDENRPLEIEAIFGNPLKAAAAVGVKLPRIAMLHHQLQFLNRDHLSHI